MRHVLISHLVKTVDRADMTTYELDLRQDQRTRHRYLVVYIPAVKTRREALQILESLVEKLVKSRVSASCNLVIIYDPCSKWARWVAKKLVEYLE